MVWIRQVFQGLNLLSVGTWSINIEVFAHCRLQKLQPDNSFKEESFPKTQLPPSIIQTGCWQRESHRGPDPWACVEEIGRAENSAGSV